MPRGIPNNPKPIDKDDDDIDLENQISALNDDEPETVSTGPNGGYVAPKSLATSDTAANGKKKNSIKMLLVTVDKDASTSPATWIHDYELPILQQIHEGGEEGVIIHKEKDGYTTMNAAEAHAQLLLKYSHQASKAVVLLTYRTPQALARDSGLPYRRGDDLAAKHQQSQIIDHSEDGMDNQPDNTPKPGERFVSANAEPGSEGGEKAE